MRKHLKSRFRVALWLILFCALILTGCSAATSYEPSIPQSVSRSSFENTTTPKPAPTIHPFDHNSITMKSVDSTSLAKMGYDADYSVLKVQFKNSGEYYIYYDVPQGIYSELVNADSIGSYFYYNVRSSFEFEKVS